MALSAKLYFGDNGAGYYFKEYLVLKCECHFTRHHVRGFPDEEPKCDKLMMVVVAPGKESHDLIDWYVNMSSLSGKIVFDMSDVTGSSSDSDKVEIFFEDARCFSMSENYDIDAYRRREFALEIISESLTIGRNTFD